MTEDRRVAELDLLAWADGQLDGDPRHRAAVEAALAGDRAACERARAFRAQTGALRAAYAWRLDDPVPDRLRAALEAPPLRARRRSAGAAAVLLVALTAGMAGWMLGRDAAPGPGGQSHAAAQLSDRGYAQFVAEQPGRRGPEVTAVVGSARPLDWLADEISIGLKAPDLSAAGWALVDKRAVTVDGERVVRLDYAGQGGSFSLFLAARWEESGQGIVEDRRGGVSMASWLEGPLVSAVVARMPPERMRRVAEAVRAAMHAGDGPPAVLQPAPPLPAIGAGVVADTVATPVGDGPPAGAPAAAAVRPN